MWSKYSGKTTCMNALAETETGEDWEKLFDQDGTLYHIEAPDRDFFNKCRNSPWVREIMRRGLPEECATGIKILEAGCANAKRTIAISTYGHTCVGLDYAKSMCIAAAHLHRTARSFWANIDVEIVQGDILTLPFEDNTFDLVYNNGVLEHFLASDTRTRALQEMLRVVRPGGRILVTVPNGQHLMEKLWHQYLIHGDAVSEVLLRKDDLENEFRKAGLWVTWSGFMGVSDSFDQWLKYRILKLPVQLADALIRKICPEPIKKYLAFHLMCIGSKPLVIQP